MTPTNPIVFKRMNRTALTLASTSILLSACAVGPDFERPSAPESQHYNAGLEQALRTADAPASLQRVDDSQKIAGNWWSTFGSAKLDQVMQRAITGNLDLAVADATIAQAGELLTAARGGLGPQVNAGAQLGRQRAMGAPTLSVSNFYAFGPQVDFDLDIFGGTRRQIEAQAAQAEFQKHRFDAAYLIVTGDVATQAFSLASARAQIDAIQKLLANDRKNLDLIKMAHDLGGATQVDVALATTQLAQDETLLPPLARQRDAAQNALALLTGKAPSDWTATDFDLDDFTLPKTLPLSLPSELARARPDILAAEAQLHTASSAIGVATADLYPHLDLSASIGRSGPGVGALWNMAAGLTAPIFSGGSLQAKRRAAIDGYKASLAIYQQTVIRSLGQVNDVLQYIEHDQDAYDAQQRALKSAERSLELNQEGFRVGEVAVLQVLDAERAYQQALIGQIRSRTALYLDSAQLFIALGGNADGAFEQRVASRDER